MICPTGSVEETSGELMKRGGDCRAGCICPLHFTCSAVVTGDMDCWFLPMKFPGRMVILHPLLTAPLECLTYQKVVHLWHHSMIFEGHYSSICSHQWCLNMTTLHCGHPLSVDTWGTSSTAWHSKGSLWRWWPCILSPGKSKAHAGPIIFVA